ncbi:MAG: hypothetical protein ABIC82_04445, partial [bacterium]
NGGTSDSALGAFFDNIKLQAISDSIYVIKDSWRTPTVCDQDWQGNSYLYYMLGCDEYSDTQGSLHYLKSFSNLCRADSVGCQKLIDIHNFNEPFGKTWNAGDEAETTVPTRNFVYLAQTQDYSCMQSSAGCAAMGSPLFNQDETIVKGFDTVYKINDPDYYELSLCLEQNVGCQTFASAAGDYNFKDPGEKVCEYIQPTYEQDYGWYKKSDSYNVNSEKCPVSNYQNLNVDFPSGVCVGGVENGKECLPAKDNQLEYQCTSKEGECVADVCSVGGASCLSKCSAGGGYCSNWTGTCMEEQSGCGAFVDPISDSSTSLVANGLFNKDLNNDFIPDGWNDTNGLIKGSSKKEYVDAIYVDGSKSFFQSPIDIKSNTAYTVSVDIKKYLTSNDDSALVEIECLNYADGFDGCPSAKDKGFYFIDEAGELASSIKTPPCSIRLEDRARLIISEDELSNDFKRYSMRVFSGTCNKVQLSIGGMGNIGQSFDNVSLKETGVYYYIDSSLNEAKRECNGYVNSEFGCVLLNNRNNGSLKTLNFTKYLNYNADELTSAPASCIDSDGSKFACNADTLMKVKPDRDCGKWFYCTKFETVGNKDICLGISICDKMNKNGKCVGNPLEYSTDTAPNNMTFDISSIDKIKNLTGYSKVGFDWSAAGKGKIEGNLPPTQMTFFGSSASLVNGDFELSSQGYSRKPLGWDTYQCSGPSGNPCDETTLCPSDEICKEGICSVGIPCDFDQDCSTGDKVCEGNKWNEQLPEFSLINNPIDAQRKSLNVFNGSNVLMLTAGSSIGQNHALSDDVYVNFSTDYVISGYINTKDLSPTSESTVYGVIQVLQDNAVIHEEKVEFGKDDWVFVQGAFISSPSSGKIKVKLADAAAFSDHCENCSGQVYFDDINIRPAITTKLPADEGYAPMSCRLYSQSDAMSCEYQNEDGYKYSGWYGYCLERDPVYPDYCLNWYPVDVVQGGGGYTSQGDSYSDRFPLYYCSKATARRLEVVEYRKGGKIDFEPCGGDGMVRWCKGCGCSGPSTCPSGYLYKNQTGASCHDVKGAKTGDQNDHYCYVIGEDGVLDDYTIKNDDGWYPYDGDLQSFGGDFTFDEANNEISPGVFSGGIKLRDADTKEIFDMNQFGELFPCVEIIRTVKDNGQARSWIGRVSSASSYAVPDLGYNYSSGYKPFGAIVNPIPASDPSEWDLLYLKHFDDPNDYANEANPGSPYKLSGGGIAQSGICSVSKTFCYDLNLSTCSAPDNSVLEIGDPSKCPADGSRVCFYNPFECSDDESCNTPFPVASPASGETYIKRLFAESYGKWVWNGSKYNAGGVNVNWSPPDQLVLADNCPGVRPAWPNDYCGISPKIENLKINGKFSDEGVLIKDGVYAALNFNSVINVQQLPLTNYVIDWGDGNITSESGLSLKDKPGTEDPHSFTYQYKYSTLYANKDEVGLNIDCGINCRDDKIYGCDKIVPFTDKSFCRVRPTIGIKDNWGWVNDFEDDGVGVDDGIGPYIYVISVL